MIYLIPAIVAVLALLALRVLVNRTHELLLRIAEHLAVAEALAEARWHETLSEGEREYWRQVAGSDIQAQVWAAFRKVTCERRAR